VVRSTSLSEKDESGKKTALKGKQDMKIERGEDKKYGDRARRGALGKRNINKITAKSESAKRQLEGEEITAGGAKTVVSRGDGDYAEHRTSGTPKGLWGGEGERSGARWEKEKEKKKELHSAQKSSKWMKSRGR